MTQGRILTSVERGILSRILEAAVKPCSQELIRQIPQTRVVGGIPTMLELRTDRSTRAADCENGPVHVRALIEGADGEIQGEILVSASKGGLSALEYAWYTDQPPTELPDPNRI